MRKDRCTYATMEITLHSGYVQYWIALTHLRLVDSSVVLLLVEAFC